MEREVGALRCSKLNCYAEFNKMVQALLHCKHLTLQAMPGARNMQGTSREYNFYLTLTNMLQQVVSNHNAESQKQELQKVYEWFQLSKPLMRPKTKASTRKPRLGLTMRDQVHATGSGVSQLLERPQTAPASFSKSESLPQREFRVTFTSSYASRSLGHDMDLIGMTFDQLKSVPNTAEKKRLNSVGDEEGKRPRSASSKSPAILSVQAHPSPDFLSGYIPPGQNTAKPSMVESVCFGEVFAYAPSVAAQMTVERTLTPPGTSEMDVLRRRLSKPPKTRAPTPLPPSNTPINPPPFCIPETRLSLATETRSEENLRLALRDIMQEEDINLQSDESSLSLFNALELDDHNSAAVMGQRGPEGASGAVPDVTMTMKHAFLPERQTGLDYYPAHAPPLETIVEADSELVSTERGGKTVDSEHTTGKTAVKKWEEEEEGREDSDSLAESHDASTLRSSELIRHSKSSHSPTKPRVVFTSNRPKSSAHTQPKRSPAVVSITFPNEQESGIKDRGTRNQWTRRPRKTPNSVAGFKKNRYRRPQTVPAIKIQSLHTVF